VILDLDEAAQAPRRADLGNFLAHLHYAQLLHGLCPRRAHAAAESLADIGRSPRRRRGSLKFYTARSLLKLALQPFRGAKSDWVSRIHRIVDEVRHLALMFPGRQGCASAPAAPQIQCRMTCGPRSIRKCPLSPPP